MWMFVTFRTKHGRYLGRFFLFLDDDLDLLLVDKAALDVSILSVDAKPKRLCTDRRNQ
jgi:hypothetical protein